MDAKAGAKQPPAAAAKPALAKKDSKDPKALTKQKTQSTTDVDKDGKTDPKSSSAADIKEAKSAELQKAEEAKVLEEIKSEMQGAPTRPAFALNCQKHNGEPIERICTVAGCKFDMFFCRLCPYSEIEHMKEHGAKTQSLEDFMIATAKFLDDRKRGPPAKENINKNIIEFAEKEEDNLKRLKEHYEGQKKKLGQDIDDFLDSIKTILEAKKRELFDTMDLQLFSIERNMKYFNNRVVDFNAFLSPELMFYQKEAIENYVKNSKDNKEVEHTFGIFRHALSGTLQDRVKEKEQKLTAMLAELKTQVDNACTYRETPPTQQNFIQIHEEIHKEVSKKMSQLKTCLSIQEMEDFSAKKQPTGKPFNPSNLPPRVPFTGISIDRTKAAVNYERLGQGHSFDIESVLTTSHKKNIVCVCAVTDDVVATGSLDETVKLWNVSQKRQVGDIVGHKAGVYSLAAFRNEKLQESLATSSNNNNNNNNKATIDKNASSPSTSKNTKKAAGASFKSTIDASENLAGSVFDISEAENLYLLTGSGIPDATIALWSLGEGKIKRRFAGHMNTVSWLVILEDGIRFASGAHDKKILIWNMFNGSLEHTLSAHGHEITGLRVVRGMNQLVSSSKDKTIVVWALDYNGDKKGALDIKKGGKGPVPAPPAAAAKKGTKTAPAPASSSKNPAETDRDHDDGASNANDGGKKLYKASVLVTLKDDKEITTINVSLFNRDLILSGSEDGKIKMWSIAHASFLKEFKGCKSSPVDFLLLESEKSTSPTDPLEFLAFCAYEDTVRAWRTDQNQKTHAAFTDPKNIKLQFRDCNPKVQILSVDNDHGVVKVALCDQSKEEKVLKVLTISPLNNMK